jgi:hypothetical protein
MGLCVIFAVYLIKLNGASTNIRSRNEFSHPQAVAKASFVTLLPAKWRYVSYDFSAEINDMNWRNYIIALAVVTSVAQPASANVQTESIPQTASGMAVARLVASEASQIAAVEGMLVSFLGELVKTSPEIAVLVESYPGIDTVWTDTMRPILQDEIRTNLPDYQAKLAALFDAEMTVPQLAEMVKFYSSPTGKMVISRVTQNNPSKAVAKEVATQVADDLTGEGDVGISAGAMKADRASAVRDLRQNITDAQRRDIARFEFSPTGRKLAQILPQKSVIDLEWANRQPSPGAIKRIDKDVPAAITAYIEKIDKQKAATTSN